jgi:hypothetical protein
MKAIALTFDYDLNKMKSNGRFWAEKVYGTKTLDIFKYSAASYATFIDKNKNIPLTIYTNNIELIERCLNEYNVDLSDSIELSEFVSDYVEGKAAGKLQSGIPELLYAAKREQQNRIFLQKCRIFLQTFFFVLKFRV